MGATSRTMQSKSIFNQVVQLGPWKIFCWWPCHFRSSAQMTVTIGRIHNQVRNNDPRAWQPRGYSKMWRNSKKKMHEEKWCPGKVWPSLMNLFIWMMRVLTKTKPWRLLSHPKLHGGDDGVIDRPVRRALQVPMDTWKFNCELNEISGPCLQLITTLIFNYVLK